MDILAGWAICITIIGSAALLAGWTIIRRRSLRPAELAAEDAMVDEQSRIW